MHVLKFALLAVHILSGAGWFGAMAYSLWVLQPRAQRYFESDSAFEQFIADVSQGARWKVLGALASIAASGIALMFVCDAPSKAWQAAIGVKAYLFLLALGIFCHASWRLWPRRIFARGEEIPRIQRQFRSIGWCLIIIAAASIVLGIAARIYG